MDSCESSMGMGSREEPRDGERTVVFGWWDGACRGVESGERTLTVGRGDIVAGVRIGLEGEMRRRFGLVTWMVSMGMGRLGDLRDEEGTRTTELCALVVRGEGWVSVVGNGSRRIVGRVGELVTLMGVVTLCEREELCFVGERG